MLAVPLLPPHPLVDLVLGGPLPLAPWAALRGLIQALVAAARMAGRWEVLPRGLMVVLAAMLQVREALAEQLGRRPAALADQVPAAAAATETALPLAAPGGPVVMITTTVAVEVVRVALVPRDRTAAMAARPAVAAGLPVLLTAVGARSK
jgi:hypothetical protein